MKTIPLTESSITAIRRDLERSALLGTTFHDLDAAQTAVDLVEYFPEFYGQFPFDDIQAEIHKWFGEWSTRPEENIPHFSGTITNNTSKLIIRALTLFAAECQQPGDSDNCEHIITKLKDAKCEHISLL